MNILGIFKKLKGNKKLEKSDSSWVVKDGAFILGRAQQFEADGCKPETIHVPNLLMDYMADIGLRKIKLRSDHYLTNDKIYHQMRGKGLL